MTTYTVYADACSPTYLDAHVVLYYKLEENAFDYSEELIPLDFTAGTTPDRTTGVVGYGQKFTAANSDYMNTAASTDVLNGAFTVSIWYNLTTSTNYHRLWDVVSKPAANYYGTGVYVQPDGTIDIQSFTGAASTNFKTTTSTALADAKQYHLAFTYTPADAIDVYINGTEAAYGTHTAGTIGWNGAGQSFYLCKRSLSNEYYCDGIADEIATFDVALNETCIDYIMDNKAQYPFSPPDVDPPAVNLTYPLNGTHYNNYNGNITINISEAGNCTLNDSNWAFYDYDAAHYNYTFYRAGTPNGNYSIQYRCRDASYNWNNATFWFVVDTTYPTITIYSPMNGSIYNANVMVNVSYYDTFLWQTNTTIKNSTGGTVYTNQSGYLYGQLYYNITEYWNIATFPDGIYNITYEAVDTHTTTEFKEQPTTETTTKDGETLTTYKADLADITFKTPDDIKLDTTTYSDRWEQTFTAITKPPATSYITISADNIVYLEHSPYPCHFIIPIGMKGYWYDCVGLKNPKVTKITDTEYMITYNFIQAVTTKSLGGLNYINKTAWLELDRTAPTITSNTTTSNTNTVQLTFNTSENVTVYWRFGLNCSGSTTGSEALSDSFTLQQLLLNDGTTYYYNVTLNDSINTNSYCINITTTSSGGGVTCLACLNTTFDCSLNYTENTTGYYLKQEYCEGGNPKMIIAALVLAPIIFGLILMLATFSLGKEHAVLKIALFLLAPISFWASMRIGLLSIVRFYDWDELELVVSQDVYWSGILFFIMLTYFLLYVFIKAIRTAAQERRQNIEY